MSNGTLVEFLIVTLPGCLWLVGQRVGEGVSTVLGMIAHYTEFVKSLTSFLWDGFFVEQVFYNYGATVLVVVGGIGVSVGVLVLVGIVVPVGVIVLVGVLVGVPVGVSVAVTTFGGLVGVAVMTTGVLDGMLVTMLGVLVGVVVTTFGVSVAVAVTTNGVPLGGGMGVCVGNGVYVYCGVYVG